MDKLTASLLFLWTHSKKGIIKRVELVRDAIKSGKNTNDIFEIGRKFNSLKCGAYDLSLA